jgi:tetratricopeptide (TPR) repeat protein
MRHMKAITTLVIGVGAALLAAPSCNTLAAGDGGAAQAAAASVFRDNPAQADPALELARLRNEAVALYESGIALDDALAKFQAAFAQSNAGVDAFNVGLVYFRQNDYATAKTWLDRALEQDPDLANAHYLLGVLARTDGDAEAAKGHWLRARELAPDDGHLHYQLALIARGERDEAGFLQSLVNALALEPDNTAALYQMFRHYQTSGSKELAAEMLARFNALKQQEKFSRREKQKDPSRLAAPILAAADAAPGFPVLEVPAGYALAIHDPGCRAVAADRYATLPGAAGGDEGEDEATAGPAETPITERVAVACADGRLRGTGDGAGFADLGRLPAGTADIRLDWLDPAGPRVLARTDAGLAVARGTVDTTAGFETVLAGAAAPVVLADLDADGDIDIATGGGQVPLTNGGKVTFIQEAEVHGDGPLPAALDGARAAVAVDLQRDGLSDLFVLNGEDLILLIGTPNGLDAAWRLPGTAEARALVVADLDNDGSLDVALAEPGQVRLLRNPGPRAEDGLPAPGVVANGTGDPGLMAASDYNNDGRQDLVLVAADGRATLLRNDGDGAFTAQTLGAWPAPAAAARLLGLDTDRDGLEDLAYVTADGALALADNATAGAGRSIALFTRGVRAAPSGRLTKVEVRRGGAYGYMQTPGAVARIGIGDADYVEILRIEWTNGFVENKLKLDAAAKPYVFTESERISGSCPSLFVWNGERFEYFTDAFISGPMGVPMDRGVYFPSKDREILAIPGHKVALRDGVLELRFTEELYETVFIDRARLYYVDLPAGTEVLPHSRTAPVPEPAYDLYVTDRLVPAARATASDGSDLTEILAGVDDRHADFFDRSWHHGFAEPHWIELQLPETVDPADVDALIATGWFYYFESTSMIAEAQLNGPSLPWPWIEQYVDGAWQDVTPLGVASGKGKSAVAPLTGQLRSRRLRVRSGIAVYWDRIAFSLGQSAGAPPAEASLVESRLRFRGFSTLASRDPERFDYHKVLYRSMWSPMQGRFTAYGPAEGLIADADGEYAIFGSGDELSLSFRVDDPEPPPGRERTYLLDFVGYVKDGDRYTGHAQRVEPVPYLGLHVYPHPDDERLRAAQTRSPFRTRAPLDYQLSVLGTPAAAAAGGAVEAASSGARTPADTPTPADAAATGDQP